jgi:uncharacterized protein with beta-barrel porin domain
MLGKSAASPWPGEGSMRAAVGAGRPNLRVLLASSSVAALLIGGGAPSAFAACSTSPTNPSGSTVNCINITGANIPGNVSNAGTINVMTHGTGIIIDNSTVGGAVINSGDIIPPPHTTQNQGNGILIENNAVVLGGISNSNTISLGGNGIWVGGDATNNAVTISTFSGGINNSGGSITSRSGTGIWVGGNASASTGNTASVTISTFSNGITNTGNISAGVDGILVGGTANGSGTASVTIATFSGNISNSSMITVSATGEEAVAAGIQVTNVGAFLGGIINSSNGIIEVSGSVPFGRAAGIAVTGVTSFGTSAAGGIANAGKIIVANSSGNAVGISVLKVATFMGGITNSSSGRITVTASSGSAIGINIAGGTGDGGTRTSTFAGGITNKGLIQVSTPSGTAIGINVSHVSTFVGGISNSGTIIASGASKEDPSYGIYVNGVATFVNGGITNAGSITGNIGIFVTNSGAVSVFDTGYINGTGGTAVQLSTPTDGKTNTFILGTTATFGSGSQVIGAAGDTFELGGTGAGTFDLSNIGNSEQFQFQNFATFNVVSGTWITSNTFGLTGVPWTVYGGTLAGTGIFQSVNVNGGTLEPGTPGVAGGKLTVNGSLVFTSGSYLVNISPSASSITVVNGTATLGGTLVLNPTGGQYVSGTSYDILKATGGLGGTKFSSMDVDGSFNFGSLTPVVTYDDVLVTLVPASLFLPAWATVNQTDVGVAISNANIATDGNLPISLDKLFSLSSSQLLSSLSQVDGEVATDAERGAFQEMDQFLELMLDPFVDGRSGAGWPVGGGGWGAPTANNFAPDQQASVPPDIALAYADVMKAPPPSTFNQRWSTWAAGFGASNTSNGDPVVGSTNVTASDYGYAAGLDYHYSPDTVAGFALAGGGTNWGLEQGLGTGRSDDFQAGLYGVTRSGPWYLAGALAFANHWMSTNRFALGDQLTASFTAQSYGVRVEGGYRYAMMVNNVPVGVTPYAALRLQSFDTPSYSETDLNGGGLGLSYTARNATDTRSELGARFDSPTVLGAMPLVLRGQLAWAHDWVSDPSLSAVFETLPGSNFTVYGAPVPKDSALATAGAVLHITSNWSFAAKFDGDFASGSETYAGSGTLRYTW